MADMIIQHIASSCSYEQYYNNEHSMVLIMTGLRVFAILIRP